MIHQCLSLYFYLLARGYTSKARVKEVMGCTGNDLQQMIIELKKSGVAIEEREEEIGLKDDSVFSFLLNERELELLESYQELLSIAREGSLERVTDILRLRLTMDRVDQGLRNKRFLRVDESNDELRGVLERAIETKKALMVLTADRGEVRDRILIPRMLLELGGVSYLSGVMADSSQVEIIKLSSITEVEDFGPTGDHHRLTMDIIVPKEYEDEIFNLVCITDVRSAVIGDSYLHVQATILDLEEISDWLDDMGEFEIIGPMELIDLFD